MIRDERFLAVHVEGRGFVVLTGCSHAGAVDVLTHVMARLCLVSCLSELGEFSAGMAMAEEAVRIAEAADHPSTRDMFATHVRPRHSSPRRLPYQNDASTPRAGGIVWYTLHALIGFIDRLAALMLFRLRPGGRGGHDDRVRDRAESPRLLLVAIRDDESAAPMVGINAFHRKALAKVISGAMAGIAGSLYLSVYRSIDPNTAFGVFAVLNAVLQGSSWGAGRPHEFTDEEYRKGLECEDRRFMALEERIRELHEKGGYARSLRKNNIVASLGTRRI